MIEKLRAYIDELFIEAPLTKKTVEMKEEIVQNLTEKYDDLLAEGKSDEAAYNIAIASIGDINELIEELKCDIRKQNNDHNSLREKQKSAIIVSVAVMIYILSVIPVILFPDTIGVIMLFVFIAVATGLLIYNGMTRSGVKYSDETIATEFKQWRESTQKRKSGFRSLTSALWAITLVVYFLISFKTGYWHITWLIFLITVAINCIIKIIFDYKV